MSARSNIAGLARRQGESLGSPLQQQEANGLSSERDISGGAQVLQHYFEEHVRLSPGRVAAVCENRELTYERLNQRANRLAHYLMRTGAGPETLVGLCVERSLEILVGILGVLKAGAAYLPLDPHYPRARLAFMLADAQVRVLLTEEHLLPQLPDTDATVIFLDRDQDEFGTESTENPAAKALPENPAYVIYTSGSTGNPKGVVVTHSNAVRLFRKTRHWFNFSQQDIWTLFHSFAFDFSVWEMWGALLHGGKVVIVPYFVSRTPEAFYELLCREQVTILNQTPSAFRQLIRAEEKVAQKGSQSLRLVIFGGEPLELQSLRPWIERHGDERPALINMFGITETTVHVTYRRILRQDMEAGQGSVIGQAIPDLQTHVCGELLTPCTAGETGELYVGGAGLARGYLHRPELTAERFIPDPFSREPGARLYRTGDLVRRLPGDDLEYMGRMDQQVKVRGFRVELGEIEGTLAQHPGVRECVVTAYDDEYGGKRLAAYVVSSHSLPALGDLHDYLRNKLPDYMLPAAIVFLQQLPLTAHGKVDHSALPPPEARTSASTAGNTGPSTPVEKILADVWIESLGLGRVGMDDNYFALGGDSIRSIKVRAKALERGLKFSLQQLFQNPTIRRLAAEISDSENPAAGHTQRPAFSMISEEDRRKLPPDADDAYPVSLLQSGMIFHSEYSPDYIVYVSSLRLRLIFDAEKMRQALDHLAAGHEMLRTSFDLNNFSIPLQIVHRATRLDLRVEDLRHFSPEEQQRRVDEWLGNETRRRFDWTHAPLFRFQAHLRGNDSVQFTMSEPFLDGWSAASLLTELFECYFALHQDGVPPQQLASSYKEFVALEQESLQSEQARNYWARLLSGGAASRLPRRTFSKAAGMQEVIRMDVPMSQETSDGLKNVARQAGVSLKSVLLAAHAKVVSTLSGQSEVFTGLLINGRPETTDGERLIGAFLNTVPFRMRLGGETWIELARKAHEIENEMLPFRRYPIQELQRLYEAERKFDTIFNYTHFHVMDRLQGIPGLEVLEMKGSEQTYYPLTAQFSVNEFSSRAELALDYRTLELGEEQVQEIAGYYSRVLEAIAANALLHHDTFCPVSREERIRLLAEPNQTSTAYSENLCLHQIFASQAQKIPDAVAVVFGGERLTYGELERRANQLARYLQEAKAGPETLVGVCMERGVHTIIGLLGILKAGGAYLPLDPEYPAERLAFMLEDAQATIVVTQEGLLGRIPEHAARRISLDSDWPQIARESSAPLVSRARPGNLAYVIYTSGSTGKPKGVLTQHGAVVNTIEASIREFGVDAASRVAQLASLNFDASVLEIFIALLSGATLFPVSRDVLMSGQKLGRFLLENAITTVAIPPSLLDLVPAGKYPAIHSIVVGGEACSAATAERWSGGRRFFNAYAPTEATIYATAMRCSEGARQAPPIGRPIQNMQVYLLDQYAQPVPAGVPGELHIGGVGVARGYLRRPELTAERFVPDPFTREPGRRLYKTGDLARFLPDGNIQFLGRTDQQVKVRGFRIELGEIETALGAHPLVQEVAVVVREDDPHEKRIVAYVVPQDDHVPTTSELRNHLKNRLPEYMLPAVFVVLDAMPLSETGKIDRALLPAPEQARPELTQSYIAPRSDLEQVLAGAFSDVLKIERIGIMDSFFELGGHSLAATQVVSRIRQLFGIDLPLRTLFEEPTVSGLAHAILKEVEAERINRTAELLLQLSELSEEEASRMLHESDSAPKEQAQ